MSQKFIPGYADPKGVIICGFGGVGYAIVTDGDTVPTDGVAGYEEGALFFKRGGTSPANLYKNEGTVSSCAFKALPASGVSGVAAGYKLARGVATITGSGDVVTGLTTVVAVVATMQADASLTNGIAVTATIGDQAGTPAAGSVTIKVWKPTASGDVTPIASAAAVAVNWIAIGVG